VLADLDELAPDAFLRLLDAFRDEDCPMEEDYYECVTKYGVLRAKLEYALAKDFATARALVRAYWRWRRRFSVERCERRLGDFDFCAGVRVALWVWERLCRSVECRA